MKKLIKNNVNWVGKVDWELRKFHGYEYSTYRGSTYNSYLIKEEKNGLIDTVFKPFAAEFVENQRKLNFQKLILLLPIMLKLTIAVHYLN